MSNIIVLSEFQKQWLHRHFLKADSIKNIGIDTDSGTLFVESIFQGTHHTTKVGVSEILPQIEEQRN